MTEPNESRRSARGASESGAPARGVSHARGGKRAKRMGVLGFLGIALAVVLVSASSVAAIAVWDVAHSAKTVELADKIASIGAIDGGFNVMVVGSDTRKGQSNNYGPDPGSTLNDVNILFHVSADHKSAVAVSIPRDMVVHIADCPGGGGGWTGPINATLSEGGVPCVVKTVEEMTGLKIPYAAMVTFDGVVDLSNIVGGVQVCVASPIIDSYTSLKIPAGLQTLKGWHALQFLRTRHGVGDGSDLGRISNQQVFLSALMRKVQSENLFTNPVMLYQIASSITKNMTLSSSLNNPDALVSMALALKNINLKNFVFVQYPGTTGGEGVYKGKVKPNTNAGDTLMQAIAADSPLAISGGLGRAAEVGKAPAPAATPSATAKASGSATPAPSATTAAQKATVLDSSVTGQSADQYTCSKGN